MRNVTYYTTEQIEEIKSLLKDGLSTTDIVELLGPKYNRPLEGLRAKIYTIINTFPPDVKRKLDMRHQNKGVPRKPAIVADTPDLKAAIASKINVVDIKHRKSELVFPVVAKHKTQQHIVLFTSLHGGVVLHAGKSALFAGHRSETFVPCTDGLQWEILEEVTLTFRS